MDAPAEFVPAPLAVLAADPSLRSRAAALAALVEAPLVDSAGPAEPERLLLVVDQDGLSLREDIPRGALVRVDYCAGRLDHRRRHGGGAGQLIARAVGLGATPLTVVDATAGLGQDAFVLAGLGCRVIAVERSPVLASMIHDALQTALARGSQPVREAAARMLVVFTDGRRYLNAIQPHPHPVDVVYLDPMYPPKEKDKAMNRKEMRLCRRLVGDDPDAAELLAAAQGVARRRVVVKRRREAPPLGEPPGIVYEEGGTRYDVYPAT